MKNLLIIILFLATLCTNKSRKIISDKHILKETYIPIEGNLRKLPSDLLNYIKTSFPNFIIPKVEQFKSDWKEYNKDKNEPFFCDADFDGDGMADYAVLLFTGRDSLNLRAFFRQNGGFSNMLIDTFNSNKDSIDVILSVLQKGKIETFDEIIEIPYDGLNVQLINDHLTISYYWKDKKFNKVLYN